jgi:hypothetical protein
MLRQREDNRRHEVRPRDFVVLQNLEELLQVEPRHRDDGHALIQAQVQDDQHPVDVIERQHADHALVGLKVHTRPQHLHHVRHEVAVGEHHAFGQPRRAAGVGQHDQVFGRD